MARIVKHSLKSIPNEYQYSAGEDSFAISRSSRDVAVRPAYRAYRVLQVGFVAAPLIAGLDKFFHILVDWDQYMSPLISNTLGVSAHSFMLVAGVIEIIAGIGVLIRPRIFAYVVSLWMVGIIGNLLLTGKYYDIALRDLGLAIGALALGTLAQAFDRRRVRRVS